MTGGVAGTGRAQFKSPADLRRLFRGWLRFAGRLMPGGRLPRRETELVILRVAHLRRCSYELAHHTRLGARAGLSGADLARVASGPAAPGWSPRERALLAATDLLHHEQDLDDTAWTALSAHLDERESIEFCLLVGHYEMLATAIAALRIEPESQELRFRADHDPYAEGDVLVLRLIRAKGTYMRRIPALVGATGLLSMLLVAPAHATGAPEVWSTGPFTVQISVTAADLNGDGYDDLVSTNLYRLGDRVLLSTGSGFLPEQNWGNAGWADTSEPRNTHLAGDVDNDGRADMIMIRQQAPRGIFVARSTVNQYGRDTFAPATQWLDNTIKGDYGNRVADLDADGDADVIGLFGVATLAARSNGTASQPLTAWAPPLRGEKATLVADATGDGSADFILVDTTGTRVVPANPRWHDTPAQWSTTPFFGTRKTLTADVDADGDADLIAVHDTGVDVMRSNGSGYDAPEVWHAEPFYGATETLTADVDGDGDADLVAVNGGNVQVLRS